MKFYLIELQNKQNHNFGFLNFLDKFLTNFADNLLKDDVRSLTNPRKLPHYVRRISKCLKNSLEIHQKQLS